MATLPPFNPTQTYTTVTDIDGDIFAFQNGVYYDKQGNTFLNPPTSRNGYAAVSSMAAGTVPQLVVSYGSPMITPPYGTISNNGALVLGAALLQPYIQAWIYCLCGSLYQSNNGNGLNNPAGWYQCSMTTTTNVTIYNNMWNGSGAMDFMANPPVFTNATAPTGNYFYSIATGGENLTALTVPIPGNSLGPNGGIRIRQQITMSSSANSKAVAICYGGNYQFVSLTLNNNNNTQFINVPTIWNTGNTHTNQGVYYTEIGVAGGGFVQGFIDTTQTQALAFMYQLPTKTQPGTVATDWFVQEYVIVETIYGA